MVRHVENILVAGLGVDQSKLLGMGTGDTVPPDFCTRGLKRAKIVFFAESRGFWYAQFIRQSTCLSRIRGNCRPLQSVKV